MLLQEREYIVFHGKLILWKESKTTIPCTENAPSEVKSKIVWVSLLEVGSRFNHLRKPNVFLLPLIWHFHINVCLLHAELSLKLQDITSNQRQTYPQVAFSLWTPSGVGVTVVLEKASILDFFFFLKNIWYNGNNNAINPRMCLSVLPKFWI